MINKFPKLSKEQIEEINNWLDIQIANYTADALKYKACGNKEEWANHSAYASCYENIKIHIKYHMEER